MPTQFPSWMQQQPQMGQMASLYRQAPQAFDTKGVEDSYGAQMAGNTARGLSMTNSMQRAAGSRALQTGGRVGASFAGGDIMRGIAQQNQSMMGDLEDYKLRAIQNRFQMQAGLAGDMAGMRQRQTGMLADFYNAGENRSQQGSQFDRGLAQSSSQFAAQHALRLRQQQEDEDRYDDALRLRQSGGGAGGGGAGVGRGGNTPSWGEASTMMAAHNANNPSALAYWQRMRQAAGAGGYMDSDVFGTGY